MKPASCSRTLVSTLAAWLLVWLLAVASSIAAEYEVIDLGTLGGTNSEAFGINDHSQVVGSAQDADGRTQAFLWQNGTMTGLGFLPGGTTSVARAINNLGEITGYAYVSSTNRHAFLYSSSQLTDIGTFGGPSSEGNAINDSGEITGWSQPLGDSDPETFIWCSNQFIRIPPYHPPYSCEGKGMNDLGFICGITFLYSPNPRWWGYVWFDSNGNSSNDVGEMKLLGSLGSWDMSGAHDINDIGQAVGWTSITNTSGFTHAFLVTSSNDIWKVPDSSINPTNLLMQDIGALVSPTNSSTAYAINNRSWIVGFSTTGSGTNQAFLWRDGVMTNLNHLIPPDSGWLLINATGINEHNEIIGTGLFSGQSRAYLLRREGRITRVEPVVHTSQWISTNEFGEIVTQTVEEVDTQVLHWAGTWGGHTAPVYSVEYCDDLPTSNWFPFAPTSQWPIVDNFWTNPAFGGSSRRFFRVRAE